MDDHPTLCISIFVLIFCINLTASEKCKDNDLYLINTKANHQYVLDATDPTKITIGEAIGSKGQSWKFQPTAIPASYFIINEQHGKVLDYQLGDDNVSYVILNDKNVESMQQYWNYVTNSGLITNFANGQNVNVYGDNITPDGSAEIALWDDEGCACQRWFLQKKA